jgi:hypothetical protein
MCLRVQLRRQSTLLSSNFRGHFLTLSWPDSPDTPKSWARFVLGHGRFRSWLPDSWFLPINSPGSGSRHGHFRDRLGRMSGNHRMINRLPLSGRRIASGGKLEYNFASGKRKNGISGLLSAQTVQQEHLANHSHAGAALKSRGGQE